MIEISKIKIQIPKAVEQILDIFSINGYEGYIVGGCVRDSILNKSPQDWDICTNCTPEKMMELLSGFKVIPTGLKHGTVTVVIDHVGYEVTTYRVDGDYRDGRHPEKVQFTASLREDLKRRDFTINAMAYHHKDGLIDYHGGMEDLWNRKIKTVGNPLERFSEDYLRMLRAVRFSAQLDYTLEERTFQGIRALSHNIGKISTERIREELNKILMTEVPSRGLVLLHDTDLLKYILPELEVCVGFNQHSPHHDKDVFNHILSVVDQTEKDLILRLAALLHDIGKPETFSLDESGIGHFYRHHVASWKTAQKIMRRLKYDNRTIDQVLALVKEHMTRYEKLSDKAIKRLISRVNPSNMHRLFKLQIADIGGSSKRNDISDVLDLKRRAERILHEKQPLSIKDLEISGHHLMELGVPEGKEIGRILNELMEIVLENPELNTTNTLLQIAREKLN